MGKNIKLKNKAPEKAREKESFFFFVKDQGEGAIRIAVIILKILELIMTTIFGLCLGIFGPICIWFGFDDPAIAGDPSTTFWLVSSIIYIIGLFILMMGHSKIASVVHLLAAAGTMLTYVNYLRMFKDTAGSNGPTVLYMPCLFITVMTVTIMLLLNMPKWIENHVRKVNERAPSILGDNDGSDE